MRAVVCNDKWGVRSPLIFNYMIKKRKTIKIRKSNDFSKSSNVLLIQNDQKVKLSSYDSIEVEILNTDIVYLRHIWTRSHKLTFSKLDDGATYEVVPILGKKFGFVFLLISSLCLILFLITNWWWFGIPLGGMGLYILVVLSLLSNRYLRLIET